MKLKKRVASLEEVDEKFRDLYVQEGDEFVLDMDDPDSKEAAASKAKVKEFRDKNIELERKLRELTERFDEIKDLDVDEARKALDEKRKFDDKKLIDAGKIDELLEKRVAQMRTDFETQIKVMKDAQSTIGTERDALRTELGRLKIDTAVQNAVNSVGQVRKGALSDVLNRARMTFKIDEAGRLVARDSNGDALFDKHGQELTIDSWGQQLLQEAPFLFEAGQGGGGGGGRKGGEGGSSVIPRNDPVAFGQNLEAIAQGKAKVAPASA